MKLRTRVLFLFVTTMVVMAVLVMVHYIHQSLMLQYFSDALDALNAQMGALVIQGEGVSLDAVFATWYEGVRAAVEDFEGYRSRAYLQTVISAVVVMVLFAVGMSSIKKHVLQRLNVIRRFVVDAYQHGWAFRRLHMPGSDELAQFSKLFNTAIDTIETNLRLYSGKLAEDRKILMTFIAMGDRQRAYFRGNGDFIGSNLPEDAEEQVIATVRQNIDEIQGLDSLNAVYPMNLEPADLVLKVEYVGPDRGTRLLICATPEIRAQKAASQ